MSGRRNDPMPSPLDGAQAVSDAIQRLMAARLGRGFLPLGLLFVGGVVSLLRGGDPWIAAGALGTAGAMLGYGLRIVQKALGRPHRAWMTLAMAGSLVPPVYSVYLVGWMGLRRMAVLEAGPLAAAIVTLVLGVWVLRSWMRVVEIERLARIMTVETVDGSGGAI